MLRGSKLQAAETTRDEAAQVVERLFTSSPVGALTVDSNGRVLRANGALARTLGRAVEALEGQLLFDHQDEGGAALVRAAIADALRGVTPAPFETRLARVDGTHATCRVTLASVLEPDGGFAYALCWVEDLSLTVATAATLKESEERFRTLVEVSPDAVIFFVSGTVVHANPAAARLLGASRIEELVGVKSIDLVHPSFHPHIRGRAAALMAGESVPAAEEIYVRLDGTPVDVEVNVARVPLPEGKAFVVIARDIRDRKEAEQRVRREREASAASAEARERELWLREIIDLLPSCIHARDEAGVFVLANRAFAEVVGRPPREVVGRSMTELGIPKDVAETSLAHDRVVLTTGTPTLVKDEPFVDRLGRPRIFETSRLPFALRSQATVLCASVDVTERKRLEAELLEAQKLEAIGRLAGGIAHDFNNLLTVLVASAEELAAERTTPNPDVALILSAANRATALTQQLLAFARKSPVDVRELAINDLVEDIVSLLARVLGEEISIVTTLDPRAGNVRLDRASMDRVLMNLAVNARDAMPDGGTLTFATQPSQTPDGGDARWVALSVTDTGVGMSEETRAHAFEPFFTTKTVGEGTGLGLATCFGIVQQAGGRIDITSERGRGTTFRILLPVVTAAVPATERARSVPPPATGGETVLLLDDDRPVLNATTRMLKGLGYVVLPALTPDEAIRIARTHPSPLDLLITDVVMPGMSGPQTAKAIQATLPDLPVLYVSGYSKDALSLADSAHVLPKPFSRVELAAKVREVLGMSRA
jgi:PAS domain S-box-containing protein